MKIKKDYLIMTAIVAVVVIFIIIFAAIVVNSISDAKEQEQKGKAEKLVEAKKPKVIPARIFCITDSVLKAIPNSTKNDIAKERASKSINSKFLDEVQKKHNNLTKLPLVFEKLYKNGENEYILKFNTEYLYSNYRIFLEVFALTDEDTAAQFSEGSKYHLAFETVADGIVWLYVASKNPEIRYTIPFIELTYNINVRLRPLFIIGIKKL